MGTSMQKPSNASPRGAGGAQDPQFSKPIILTRDNSGVGTFWDMLVIRVLFLVVASVAGYHFQPFGLSHLSGVGIGFGFALAVVLVEVRLRKTSLRRLIGASVATILGILGAYLTSVILMHTTMPERTRSFLSVSIFLLVAYVGVILGASKGDMLNLQAFGGVFGSERGSRHVTKLLDTSVIIDGLVADSADPLKRQRGRRGLEVLQRIQKMQHLDVQIAEDDFPHIADVDLKLIELAKRYDAKIVTNDFNLNKIATLQGIEIMNVNLLANALKPVVLPGESMRVFILREGKEYNQGVAYLDDGTMVVVDGARKMINKTIDISVTSVHQTTAGKMIFGRFDDRNEQGPRPAVAASGGDPAGARSIDAAAGGQSTERPPRPFYPEPSR